MQANLVLSISDGIQFVPTDWDVSHTESHWISKASLLLHFAKVIVPYVNEIQKEVSLDADRINQKAVTIFDIFAANHTYSLIAKSNTISSSFLSEPQVLISCNLGCDRKLRQQEHFKSGIP